MVNQGFIFFAEQACCLAVPSPVLSLQGEIRASHSCTYEQDTVNIKYVLGKALTRAGFELEPTVLVFASADAALFN